MVEYILSIKEVKQRYIEDDALLWRMLYVLFAKRTNKEAREYVLGQFEECKSKFIDIVSKRYPGKDGNYGSGAYLFEYYSIINNVVRNVGVENLSELRSFIGYETFYDGVFLKDAWNENAIGGAISQKKLKALKFLLNIDKIKQSCQNDKDKLHGIVTALCKHLNEPIAKYLIYELELTETRINELIEYKYFDATKILTLL